VNDEKAREAHRLVWRVDDLITSHATAAHELKEYVSQLSSMSAEIDAAARQASNPPSPLSSHPYSKYTGV